MNTIFIYGFNLVSDLILSDYKRKITHLYIKEKHRFLKEIIKSKIPYTIWKKEKFEKKFSNENHQYIAAEIIKKNFLTLKNLWNSLKKEESDPKLLLILDHLQDPFNFGNIIRTAKAAGVNGIIIPNKNQVSLNRQAMKAAAHHLYDLKIFQVTNLYDCIKKLKKQNFWIVSTKANAKITYDVFESEKTNIALIIGNENKGVSELLNKNSDYIIKIPMKNVESLNVSNATAILLYEIRRKQNFWKKSKNISLSC